MATPTLVALNPDATYERAALRDALEETASMLDTLDAFHTIAGADPSGPLAAPFTVRGRAYGRMHHAARREANRGH